MSPGLIIFYGVLCIGAGFVYGWSARGHRDRKMRRG